MKRKVWSANCRSKQQIEEEGASIGGDCTNKVTTMWRLLLFAMAASQGYAAKLLAVPSPVMACDVESTDWKAPQEYLDMRRHDVVNRDHGCADFPEEVEQTWHCTDIWIKNKFSEANQAPSQVLLEFQYYHDDFSGDNPRKFSPAITWVESITPWKVRGCAAVPGGNHFNALAEGKLRWLAIYGITQTNTEQAGKFSLDPFTHGTLCRRINFPQNFQSAPKIKLTLRNTCQTHAGFDPVMLWVKDLQTSGFDLCYSEFNNFANYHRGLEVHWYAASIRPSEDQASEIGSVTFNAGDAYPVDHNNLNFFYCKNVTVNRWHYPCHAVMLQVVEQSTDVCESELVAWAPYVYGNTMTVCYMDKRGLMGVRKASVDIHWIIFGYYDKCQDQVCPPTKECIHPTWDTVACGCYLECPDVEDTVCGSDMVTYENLCSLEKAACENNTGVFYYHHGPCEPLIHDSGRIQLDRVTDCSGLYCKYVDLKYVTFYEHANTHVQISVNWMNDIGATASVHDAAASWVEDVSGKGFKACVMEAGRRDLLQAPYVNWFAYQGDLGGNVTSGTVELGDWLSGTHCAPLHERTMIEKPLPWLPPMCMDYVNKMGGLSDNMAAGINIMGGMDEDSASKLSILRQNKGMLYDHHLMAAVYGNHHHEWFKRIMMGYGVERMKLTDGMQLKGSTVMLTVELPDDDDDDDDNNRQDAVNVWLEYDNQTQEAYVCARELQNFAGKHTGVHVHWMLVRHPNVMDFGYHQHVMFKPHYFAPMYSNYAFCQTKQWLPAEHDLPDSATLLVSLVHKIPQHATMESIKNLQVANLEVEKEMSMGDADLNDDRVVESWMLPHLWRANLTGWRPSDRIAKNNDYSAWIEGFNNSHVKVCQKSIYSGFHFEGVSVSVLALPDRCPSGFQYIAKKGYRRGFCAKFHPQCTLKAQASASCLSQNAVLSAPEDLRDTYLISNVGEGVRIQLALNDAQNEGRWVRDSQNPSPSNYTRFGPGLPDGGSGSNCVELRGRDQFYTYNDIPCSECRPYTCVNEPPFLSCEGYCMNCGRCTYRGRFDRTCECVPPYTGSRCERKL